MQKELNLQGDKYIAYSPDNVNWVCVAAEDIIPEFDVITDNQEFNAYLTGIARDGIVESIKALKLPIAKPKVEYYQSNLDLSNKKHKIRYVVRYFDNDYYVRTKMDRQKRRLAYYFYKNEDDVAKLLKFNNIKWLCEDFYE